MTKKQKIKFIALLSTTASLAIGSYFFKKKVEKMNDRYKKVNELEVKQMTLFDTVKDDDIIKDIKELDISNMTPIDALNILYKLQGKVKNRYLVNEN